MVDVKFEVPKMAKVGETIILRAIVTYGDEKVKDADEVEFEYWEEGKREKSTMVKTMNELNLEVNNKDKR